MNPAIEKVILAVSGSWALSTLVKATFVMTIGLGAAALAGRKRAAFRHALMAGLFGALLALPAVSALAPPVGIVLRAAQSQSTPAARVRGVASPVAAASMPASPEPPQWRISEWLTVMWLAGIASFLLPVGAGLRRVFGLRRSALPWQDGQSLADGLARDVGLRRRVEVMLHEGTPGPMTCGVARPAIVLPVEAPDWDSEDVHRAMVHELEHVRRSDWAIRCVARAVCAVYWFHPLVWMAWRRLELEAERACDDAVLERSEATAYADQLVSIARRLSAAARSPLLAMANRADLSSRVKSVLDAHQRRGRAGALCVTLAAIAASALVVAIAPLRMAAAPQSASVGGARLRSETKLEVTQVKVSYPNGNTVEGLRADDFEVKEDSVPQKVVVCEFQTGDGADPTSGYYLVGYYPRNIRVDGQFRKVDIAVKTATAAKVEHRAGYFMTEPPGLAASSVVASRAAGGEAPPYDKPPVLIFKKEAEYPDAARKAKYQGIVLLDVDIDTSGLVAGIRVARSAGLGLDEQAIEAVKQWRFRPATKNSNPVNTQATVEVSFRLL
jgi:TonB family protein